ncbi:unnamed protein product (macronuclear) [Paramecium tetraurelia]|uniref:Coiled-coil domain-containing protein n=1 Tax=Paramecium tetraurelia TaxID=5888 RepID=A0CSF4_PARTE|nr:uncharacterized protein GSPATT00009993001 [Paramecium tetraurelia]CAK73721.1 unnamed protein product [Paramecium tetraurelia]|eukprot:XP_001441118.1 hypothetical protein (macronuclear) [Paramecium tetraurelia strain d4-2]
MCLEEAQDDKGLDKFLKMAIKYYETKYGTPQRNLREKAMTLWLDLPSYKDKMIVMEFMQRKIDKIESSQKKITQFFKSYSKPSATKIIKQVDQVDDQEITGPLIEENTPKKRDKSPYSKFYEETYWKLKLEYESLNQKEIRQMVKKQWESNRKTIQFG